MNTEPLFPFMGDGAAQWLMTALTSISTVVSAVAVWFVWKSLKLNRDAIEIAMRANETTTHSVDIAREANEIAKLEQRAWISVQNSNISNFSFTEMNGGPGFSATAVINIKNFGHSVATECSVDVDIVLCGEETLPEAALKDFCERWDVDRNASGQILFPDQAYEAHHGVAIFQKSVIEKPYPFVQGSINPWLLACVTYRVMGSETRRHTGVAYPLVHVKENGGLRLVDTTIPEWAEKMRLAEPIYTKIT